MEPTNGVGGAGGGGGASDPNAAIDRMRALFDETTAQQAETTEVSTKGRMAMATLREKPN